MITFCSNKLIFKGKILFPPPKIFVKWNKKCSYTSCLGFFFLELGFQQLSAAFTGGGGGSQVTSDEQTYWNPQAK